MLMHYFIFVLLLSMYGLSQVEEMLISRVLPVMSIYRLHRGQYSYSGHIHNLPQDVTSFVNELPRYPATLDVVIVRREGTDETHRDFQVWRAVVLRALQWLIINNMYYNDVVINNDTLAMLPVDSHLTNLTSVTLPSSEVEFSAEHNDNLYGAHLQSTFVPASAHGRTLSIVTDARCDISLLRLAPTCFSICLVLVNLQKSGRYGLSRTNQTSSDAPECTLL